MATCPALGDTPHGLMALPAASRSRLPAACACPVMKALLLSEKGGEKPVESSDLTQSCSRPPSEQRGGKRGWQKGRCPSAGIGGLGERRAAGAAAPAEPRHPSLLPGGTSSHLHSHRERSACPPPVLFSLGHLAGFLMGLAVFRTCLFAYWPSGETMGLGTRAPASGLAALSKAPPCGSLERVCLSPQLVWMEAGHAHHGVPSNPLMRCTF